MSRRSFSLPGRLAGLIVSGLVMLAVLSFLGLRHTGLPPWLVLLTSLGVVTPLVIWGVNLFLRPLHHTLRRLKDGILSFRDRDFSVRLPAGRDDELGDLLRMYNQVGDILGEERGQVRQRELLLQTALDRSPVAIVMVNPLERVIYANREAVRLFVGTGRLQGRKFDEILESCPVEMQAVLAGREDGIFTVEREDEPETYHMARREFRLNRRRHTLYLLRRMTAELSRQEAEIWKKVIRVISHELNNSLAPISSLAHSAALIAGKPEHSGRMEEIHESIRERVEHLTAFLEGYARFARIPQPAPREVSWEDLLSGPRELYRFTLDAELPDIPGYFDPSQMQQVVINLLKNAAESSDDRPEISMRVDVMPDGWAVLQVLDRGRGMSDEVMKNALLPFYSTKKEGGGLGLPLCREIIEAHGGAIRIQNRRDGGTAVSFRLPPRP